MLIIFHLPPFTGQVQLNTLRHSPFAITERMLRLRIVPFTVLLDGNNITILPVYSLAPACNPLRSIRIDLRPIYVRNESLGFKRLGTC
jgi:hypothetical protein